MRRKRRERPSGEPTSSPQAARVDAVIYLDHAATSLSKPPEVIAAMVAALNEAGNPARGGHHAARRAETIINEARHAVATLLGAEDPRRIVFALNGTDALNIALHGVLGGLAGGGSVDVKHGDSHGHSSSSRHVITSVLEHNSITRPLVALQAESRIELDRVGASSEGVIDLEELAAALRPETRLVALTMASNALGTLQPYAKFVELVRSRSNAFILFDAAQVVGAVPMSLATLGADLVAAPGHKALLGPTGTGILYVGPRVMPSLEGPGAKIGVFRSGGTGGDSRLEQMPPELPHRLEGGTPNVAGIAGLGAGAAWVAKRGVSAIRAHELKLIEQALTGLRALHAVRVIGPAAASARTGAVSFTIDHFDPLDVSMMLDAGSSIAVRAGLHCAPGAHRAVGTFPAGTVRLSVGPMTTAEEIDALVRAVGEIR